MPIKFVFKLQLEKEYSLLALNDAMILEIINMMLVKTLNLHINANLTLLP